MKVLMKPIDMIANYPYNGLPIPLKYRISVADGINKIIKVDHILSRTEEKRAGNKMLIYRCQSIIDGIEKVYELKYEVRTCRWFLFKL
ncbi:MAG: hypothetical protein ACOX3A_10850 [bacterium]|jgi:hypothetical protein